MSNNNLLCCILNISLCITIKQLNKVYFRFNLLEISLVNLYSDSLAFSDVYKRIHIELIKYLFRFKINNRYIC